MTKYKIIYDRKKCMGAAECENLDPAMWVIAKDGKANLLKAVMRPDGIYELTLDDDKLEKRKEVANSCPAFCISVTKSE